MRKINAHTLRAARDVVTNKAVNAAFPLFERAGLHVVRNHLYNPLPDRRIQKLPGLVTPGTKEGTGVENSGARDLG